MVGRNWKTKQIWKGSHRYIQGLVYPWLDPFTHLQQIKSNLLPSEDHAGAEILDEDLILANDLSAALQKMAGTSTKFSEILCKQVKKPLQNKLAACQLEMMKRMAQVMCQCLKKKTASPAQESAEDFWENGCFRTKANSPTYENPNQA